MAYMHKNLLSLLVECMRCTNRELTFHTFSGAMIYITVPFLIESQACDVTPLPQPEWQHFSPHVSRLSHTATPSLQIHFRGLILESLNHYLSAVSYYDIVNSPQKEEIVLYLYLSW